MPTQNRTWSEVDKTLKKAQSKLTVKAVEAAIKKYAAQHGRSPKSTDGDASAYIGMDKTWRAVNDFLREKGETLLQRAAKLLPKTTRPK